MPSEMSESQKDKACMIPLLAGHQNGPRHRQTVAWLLTVGTGIGSSCLMSMEFVLQDDSGDGWW